MKKELIQKIQLIPPKPGVYLFKDATGRILYIGKALNLKNRVSSHFKKDDSLIGQFRQKIAAIDYIETENETQALLLEDQLIKKYQPKFNIQQKDDKSYFWVNFTQDEWPRVQVAHKNTTIRHPEFISGSHGIPKQVRHDKMLIGPFVNGTELKKVLRALRKILPYRTCKNSYEKPCLQWHLGLCVAHNPSSKVKSQKSKLNEEYLNLLNTLKQLLRFYVGESIRIEAYDISNIQGINATGSMIVFAGSKPKKSDYRKFKIRYENSDGRIRISRAPQSGASERLSYAANDVAMLKEVLSRRLNHREWPLPDLILIDGGRAQLNSSVLEIRNWKLEIPLFSLAKKEDELYTIYSKKTLRLSALPVSLRLTLQAIRNEAHRFAISYYRKLHRKNIQK